MRYLAIALVLTVSCATTPEGPPLFEVEWAGDSRAAAPLWVCGETTPGKLTCIDVPSFVETVERRRVRRDADL